MRISKLLLPCLLVLTLAASASADCGGLGLAYLYGYGGVNNMGMRSYNNYTPPYFSMHPPVYYGQRFTRPYGASPFAAWPQLQPSAAYAPQPHVDRSLMIHNHYVPAAEVIAAPAVVQSAPVQPLVIENPHFNDQAVRYTAK
ncbi:MAG: hypothetical protein R3C53_14485 [Pirellulaceae bacterium]